MTTVLVLQPSAGNPLGPMQDWLLDGAAELTIVRPYLGEQIPVSLDGVDAMVCLGGETNANDDVASPWLIPLRALLSAAVGQRVPLLAICLGAQLLAVATGGAVRPMDAGPESGLRLVAKRDAAATDPLLSGLPFTPDVVQFHQDEVSRLPAAAQLLAVSEHCTNQAFRVGPAAWGLQFHIETTPELFREWMAQEPEVAAALPASTHVPGVLEQGHSDVAETWAPIVRRFVELASRGPGKGVGEGRVDLPVLGQS